MQPSRGIPGDPPRADPTRDPGAVPWRACTAEFAGTFLMVAWGLSAVVFMMSASSPVHALIPVYRVRLLLTGILFAAGGTAVVYSPLGQRSGGHINPAVVTDTYRNLWVYFLGPLGGAAAWLASDASDYVNGTSLYVDGGMTLFPGFSTSG